MSVQKDKIFSIFLVSDNASKRCFGNSIWDNQSDYSECREQCLVDPFLRELGGNLTWDTWEDCYSEGHDTLVTDISEVIYYVGECGQDAGL